MMRRESDVGFNTNELHPNSVIISVYSLLEKRTIYSSSNLSLYQATGYAQEEASCVADVFLLKVVHPQDRNKLVAYQEKKLCITAEQELQIEYRVLHKNGKDVIWLLTTDRVFDFTSAGIVKSIISATQIVTKEKQLEIKYTESEERLRLAIGSTRSGLWEWNDQNPQNVFLSDECYSILGYEKKEFNGNFKKLVNLINPEHRESVKSQVDAYFENPEAPFEFDLQFLTKEKGYIWCRMNGQLQKNESSSLTKLVGTIADVNEKKVAERHMEELNLSLEQFAYLASHDLKEPLLTVTSLTKLFKKEYQSQLDENAFQYIDFIDQSITRMVTLTDDLLRYSQLDSRSLKFKSVDLDKLVNNIQKDLSTRISEKGAVIDVEKLPKLVCDASQIKQLFQNLISNGLKYQLEGAKPELNIGYRVVDEGTEFFVKDNGIGIAPRHQKQIWEIFKRLHGPSEYEGSGIGLANCKRIVDNHNGSIALDSQQGEGATFYFTIPNLLEDD